MYDIFGLGNALVDTEVTIGEDFLDRHDLTKGHMTLVDDTQMQLLASDVEELPHTKSSGGSAANTVYTAQALGLSTCYGCRVADDATGDFFINDLRASGVMVQANAQVSSELGASGKCLVLISGDAERTMMTNLGTSVALSTNEVDDEALQNSRYFYVEGYLSASESATAATVHCRKLCEQNAVEIALSLSDVSMVQFCRPGLEQMLGNGIQHLFCNEEEALAWAKTDRLDIAIAELRDIAQDVYITLGAKGAVAINRNGVKSVAGFKVSPIDTTGAGDIYAGAVLFARSRNATPEEAARFGNFFAANLVTHYGARLQQLGDYAELSQRYH
ncbi:MAG: adenosine kinase [Pseudomonadales bacterium]|nr:adenosine kinase [Pseudomonadales bacterium]